MDGVRYEIQKLGEQLVKMRTIYEETLRRLDGKGEPVKKLDFNDMVWQSQADQARFMVEHIKTLKTLVLFDAKKEDKMRELRAFCEENGV